MIDPNKPQENGGQRDEPARTEVTRILDRAIEGDELAIDELLPLVYAQLRAMAQPCLGAERPDHTLSATALVHEAYLKLVGPRRIRDTSTRPDTDIASCLLRTTRSSTSLMEKT